MELVNKLPDPLAYWYVHVYDQDIKLTSQINKPLLFDEDCIRYVNTFPGFKFKDLDKCKAAYDKRQDDIAFVWDHVKMFYVKAVSRPLIFLRHGLVM